MESEQAREDTVQFISWILGGSQAGDAKRCGGLTTRDRSQEGSEVWAAPYLCDGVM